MTEQKRAAVEYTQEELETMVKAVLNGATIGDVCNVSQDMLESLYSLGYNLYTSGNYKDAETVFSGLCLYDHNDPRFWMGLAGSRQANGKYQEAVDAYGLCSAMGALASPVPVLQAGMCYLKMGDREKALRLAEELATSRLWAVAAPTQVRPMNFFENPNLREFLLEPESLRRIREAAFIDNGNLIRK